MLKIILIKIILILAQSSLTLVQGSLIGFI